MGKPKEAMNERSEINSENTQIVMGHFSSSLRIKTIIAFILALIIPFVILACIVYFELPSMYVKYEDKLSKGQVRNFLKSVQVSIATIRVNICYNSKYEFAYTYIYQTIHFFFNIFYYCYCFMTHICTIGQFINRLVYGSCCRCCRSL